MRYENVCLSAIRCDLWRRRRRMFFFMLEIPFLNGIYIWYILITVAAVIHHRHWDQKKNPPRPCRCRRCFVFQFQFSKSQHNARLFQFQNIKPIGRWPKIGLVLLLFNKTWQSLRYGRGGLGSGQCEAKPSSLSPVWVNIDSQLAFVMEM